MIYRRYRTETLLGSHMVQIPIAVQKEAYADIKMTLRRNRGRSLLREHVP